MYIVSFHCDEMMSVCKIISVARKVSSPPVWSSRLVSLILRFRLVSRSHTVLLGKRVWRHNPIGESRHLHLVRLVYLSMPEKRTRNAWFLSVRRQSIVRNLSSFVEPSIVKLSRGRKYSVSVSRCARQRLSIFTRSGSSVALREPLKHTLTYNVDGCKCVNQQKKKKKKW